MGFLSGKMVFAVVGGIAVAETVRRLAGDKLKPIPLVGSQIFEQHFERGQYGYLASAGLGALAGLGVHHLFGLP